MISLVNMKKNGNGTLNLAFVSGKEYDFFGKNGKGTLRNAKNINILFLVSFVEVEK